MRDNKSIIDPKMDKIDRVYKIFEQCQLDGNLWGENFWGNVVCALMRAESWRSYPK